jgi:hypothetical protein
MGEYVAWRWEFVKENLQYIEVLEAATHIMMGRYVAEGIAHGTEQKTGFGRRHTQTPPLSGSTGLPRGRHSGPTAFACGFRLRQDFGWTSRRASLASYPAAMPFEHFPSLGVTLLAASHAASSQLLTIYSLDRIYRIKRIKSRFLFLVVGLMQKPNNQKQVA